MYRFMRLIVFFDLPVETSTDRRNYRTFRKFLIKSGFHMMQESVYVKLVLNGTKANTTINQVKKHKPPSGKVQLLKVTEKQFSRMEYIVGKESSDVLITDERTVIL